MKRLFSIFAALLMAAIAVAQGFDQINTNGNGYLSDGDSQQQNRNFNKHNNLGCGPSTADLAT